MYHIVHFIDYIKINIINIRQNKNNFNFILILMLIFMQKIAHISHKGNTFLKWVLWGFFLRCFVFVCVLFLRFGKPVLSELFCSNITTSLPQYHIMRRRTGVFYGKVYKLQRRNFVWYRMSLPIVLQREFRWQSHWYHFHQSYSTMFGVLHRKRMQQPWMWCNRLSSGQGATVFQLFSGTGSNIVSNSQSLWRRWGMPYTRNEGIWWKIFYFHVFTKETLWCLQTWCHFW